MNQVDIDNPGRKTIRRAGWTIACMTGLLATACAVSYLSDSAKLRHIAQQASQGISNDSEKVIALMDWVHNNKGFHENDNCFVFKKLRATPLQVLESGGDCADKSRLLCALLREVGIQSTMVMCFHRDTDDSTHTVVEAKTGAGQFMVVDPVYGLSFPKSEPDGFYGLLDLRADPQILDRRLSDLLRSSPRGSPLHSYNPTSAAYDHACSINWNKNAATRTVHSLLVSLYGSHVYRLRRPLILEEPKLFLASALAVIAVCIVVATRIGCSLFASRVPVPSRAGAALCGR